MTYKPGDKVLFKQDYQAGTWLRGVVISRTDSLYVVEAIDDYLVSDVVRLHSELRLDTASIFSEEAIE